MSRTQEARARGVSLAVEPEQTLGIEHGTVQFMDGAQSSQLAAQNLNELAAKLARLTERYRVATG